jgi:DNA ligase-1
MSLYSPEYSFDGELYCHGMPLQDIKGILTQSRKATSELAPKLDYNVFDLIADASFDTRLSHFQYRNYQPHVIPVLVHNKANLEYELHKATQAGFEGVMIREPSGYYKIGRSLSLLKYKPLQRATVTILDSIQGNVGKYQDRLGAFVVAWNNREFKVGGGNISELERLELWNKRAELVGKQLVIEYRELTKDNIPAQAQIKEIIC